MATTITDEPEFTTIFPDCPDCGGSGKALIRSALTTYSEVFEIEGECHRCKGEGWIEVEVCSDCEKDENGCQCVEEMETVV